VLEFSGLRGACFGVHQAFEVRERGGVLGGGFDNLGFHGAGEEWVFNSVIDFQSRAFTLATVNKVLPVEKREPSPMLKRAMREADAGIGLVRVGSTKEEIHAWTRRIYERAGKKPKG